MFVNSDFSDLLSLFNANQVKYLVRGIYTHAKPHGHRRRGVHRLELRALHAGQVPGLPHPGLRQADLCRQPGQPAGRRRRSALRLRAGGHLRRGRGDRGDPGARHRHDRQLRGRNARGPLDHGPRRVHQDRRLRHLRAAGGRAPAQTGALPPDIDRRGLRPHPRRSPLPGDRRGGAAQPLRGQQDQRRPDGDRLSCHLRLAGDHHPRGQQHRAVPVPGEGHPALRHQRHRRSAAAGVRRRQAAPRLSVRAGSLRGDRRGAAQGRRSARSTTSAPAARWKT